MVPLAARDWLTSIDGIGVKTASVVLMMSFGMPLMPVDRHVERVSKRIGLLPPKVSAVEAHDRYLALLSPGQCYPLHVGLITHGRNLCVARSPRCDECPIALRCREVDRRAP
jgi:endonuclease-3